MSDADAVMSTARLTFHDRYSSIVVLVAPARMHPCGLDNIHLSGLDLADCFRFPWARVFSALRTSAQARISCCRTDPYQRNTTMYGRINSYLHIFNNWNYNKFLLRIDMVNDMIPMWSQGLNKEERCKLSMLELMSMPNQLVHCLDKPNITLQVSINFNFFWKVNVYIPNMI